MATVASRARAWTLDSIPSQILLASLPSEFPLALELSRVATRVLPACCVMMGCISYQATTHAHAHAMHASMHAPDTPPNVSPPFHPSPAPIQVSSLEDGASHVAESNPSEPWSPP